MLFDLNRSISHLYIT